MENNTTNQGSLFNINSSAKTEEPVECLGITFDNDHKRREYFLEKLREKLKDPEFRKIEGFPIGSDEEILALSDPPYYTACPNPFIADFINHYGKPYDSSKPYSREPFAADVSEGKNDPIYNAHSYHTKVPHKAIMRYILHYTEPGDVVFDGFCGTGMTGVAAQMCGDQTTVESLGYKVSSDGKIVGIDGEHFSSIGIRKSIVNDLSPLATFMSYNLINPLSKLSFSKCYSDLLSLCNGYEERFYKSFDDIGKPQGLINYVIWSDVYICKDCTKEYSYWDAAVNLEKGLANNIFNCPHCGSIQSTRNHERSYSTDIDPLLGKPIRMFKQVPVWVSYIPSGKRRLQRPWNQHDANLLKSIPALENKIYSFPIVQMMKGDRWHRDAFDDKGVTHIHHFYTTRALEVLATVWELIPEATKNYSEQMALRFLFTSFADRNATKRNRFVINVHNPHGRVNGPMANTLYLPNLFCEMNIFRLMEDKFKDIKSAFPERTLYQKSSLITTGSASDLKGIPSNSIDYIFTDPPFGHNIQYSELNVSLESFLGVRTDGHNDAVVNEMTGKPMNVYVKIMLGAFMEYYRILKPGRWMTVEFHNSQSAVWSAIQEAVGRAGFIIAHVAILDKKQKTMHQDTNINGTVNQDLVISLYKPNSGLEARFRLEAGNEDGVWDFVRTHLRQLPIFVSNDGQAEVIAERQNYLLFDRMVAFHVQRGVTVPISAVEFYTGLIKRFSERDGMFFLPEQVTEYDKKRMTVREILQLKLFVTDESSAILWLKQQLIKKPQTFQELNPHFIKEICGWQKYEKQLELSELLEQNFLRYDGKGDVPSQIHSYLSTNFKELRNLSKDDESLRAKGKDRWYVPDPKKAGDLEMVRDKALLKEFEEYLNSAPQKRLKVFRLEAIRAGFKKAWQEHDYVTIMTVARKIPENILQEDPKLLMWYDQAITRSGEE